MSVPHPRRKPITEDRRVRFSTEAVLEMRCRVAAGESQWAVARSHGTDQSVVSRIVRRLVRRNA